jgi:signal transduction histidine kinase
METQTSVIARLLGRGGARGGLSRAWWAALALGIAGVLGVVGATSWWSISEHRRSTEALRVAEGERVAATLSTIATLALSANDPAPGVASLRQAAADAGLTRARIVLGNGTVVLDALGTSQAPATTGDWPEISTAAGSSTTRVGEDLVVTRVVDAGERGRALLEIGLSGPASDATERRLLLGAAVAGGLGIVGVLGAMLSTRRLMQTAAAVLSSLRERATGERLVSVLRVGERLGAEAKEFNALLDELDRARRGVAASGGGALGVAGESGRVDASTGASLAGSNRVAAGAVAARVLDAVWHGVIVVRSDMTIELANGASAVLLGVGRDELVGRELGAVFGDAGVVDAVRGALKGDGPARRTVEMRRTRPGTGATAGIFRVGVRAGVRGATPALGRVSPSGAASDGELAVVMIEDVTQQRVADEARNAFVAQAAHELRTPLTNVLLYVETLLEDREEQASNKGERMRAVNVINQEARRLDRIVADMLSVSEMDTGSMTPRRDDVRLDQLFEELAGDFGAQAQEKSVALKFELPPKLPVIVGDRDRVMLCVQNLVGNALKYTPGGGTVTVRVRVEDRAGAASTPAVGAGNGSNGGNATASANDGGVFVEVSDTGIGVREDEQELIFERFYRAKDARVTSITGTGLGLALARQVARMHRGDVTLRSTIDKGSTFTLRLPMAA